MRRVRGLARQLKPKLRRSLMSTPEPEVVADVRGTLARVLLNRPSKFNALNLSMVRALHPLYDSWLDADSGVRCVLMSGAGEKAFCAGGDVAAVREEVLSGGSLPADFFFEEYQLNHKIATAHDRAGIVQVSLWDGVTMGGGVGLSLHGKFRVATERTLFAMPETGIGLFPDVGGTFALSRVRGGLPVGLFCALTGARLRTADCLWAGLATHYVPSNAVPELERALEALGPRAGDADAVDATIREVGAGAEPDASKSVLAPNAAAIAECFSAPTAEQVIARLEGLDTEWGIATAKTLRKMSPTSVKVTMEAVLRHAAPDVEIGDALRTEYRLSQRCMVSDADFCEGIRAVLVDKDHAPKWSPSELSKVTDETVKSFFEPLQSGHQRGELEL